MSSMAIRMDLANAGDSFWRGAKSGADMAGNWVKTYDQGKQWSDENEFKKRSKAIEEQWKKDQEFAAGLGTEAERASYLNVARRNMADDYRAASHSILGSKGVDTYGKHTLNMDNTNKMLNNADRFQNMEKGGQDMRNFHYGNQSMQLLNDFRSGDEIAVDTLNAVSGLYAGSTMTTKDGVVMWGPEGEQVPLDMSTYASLGDKVFSLADAVNEYDSKSSGWKRPTPVKVTAAGYSGTAGQIARAGANAYNAAAGAALAGYDLGQKNKE